MIVQCIIRFDGALDDLQKILEIRAYVRGVFQARRLPILAEGGVPLCLSTMWGIGFR